MIFPAAFLVAVLTLAGYLEAQAQARRLDKIPIRILVNGTRGKSTVTRLIAAGLRACGVRTLAKTTGSAARVVLPDGSEAPVRRSGPARITEQLGVTKRACELEAKAIVVECMAIEPENQRVFERQLVRSTLGVLTNVRLDHRDAMGSSEREIAAALASTIPRGGVFLVSSGAFDDYFRAECERRGSSFASVGRESLSDEERSGFPYPMLADNLALALAVCENLGLDRGKAFGGMKAAQPDPGVNPIRGAVWKGVSFTVVDAFAANDIESTGIVWDEFARPLLRPDAKNVAIINHRADRPFRISEMRDFCDKKPFDLVVFCGDLGRLAVRMSSRKGGPSQQGRARKTLRERNPAKILDLIAEERGSVPEGGSASGGARVLLFLAGNIKGDGMKFLDFIRGLEEGGER